VREKVKKEIKMDREKEGKRKIEKDRALRFIIII